MAKLRLGMIGAGLFARDAHAPALNKLQDSIEVVAIASRTAESCQALADLFPKRPSLYTEVDELLARPDIDAVDIVLPIDLQPAMIEKALAAGKHVISEKPAAPSVAIGQALLEVAAQYPHLHWSVAENWRYEEAMQQAKAILEAGEIGTPYFFHWAQNIPMTPQNKYYHTAWRRDNSFPGGFALDAGVHHMAGLRMLLGEVTLVSALATQHRDDLPPVDTISASLRFASGVVGSYAVTYVSGTPGKQLLYISGEKGVLGVQRGEIELTVGDQTHLIHTTAYDSIEKELADFARLVREGGTNNASAQAALQEVAIIEAMLTSAATGQHLAPAQIV